MVAIRATGATAVVVVLRDETQVTAADSAAIGSLPTHWTAHNLTE